MTRRVLRVAAALTVVGATTGSMSAAAPPLPGPQSKGPTMPYVVSPEVNGRRVTFRVRAARAREVLLLGGWRLDGIPMSRDAEGIWRVTVGPLSVGLHTYHFQVDGMRMPDPGNPIIRPQRFQMGSMFEIEGDTPDASTLRDVPRGAVRTYELRVRGGVRRLAVYTPAVYEREPAARYPVLYLLHGEGDTVATWSEYGRAPRILDGLIADRLMAPAVVVMPEGHVVPVVTDEEMSVFLARNAAVFVPELVDGILPFVERNLRVGRTRAARSIFGFSMGAFQALQVAIEKPQVFGWVGAFEPRFLPAPLAAAAEPAWTQRARAWPIVALGTTTADEHAGDLEALAARMKAAGIRATFRLRPPGWGNWRIHLADVAKTLYGPGARRARGEQLSRTGREEGP